MKTIKEINIPEIDISEIDAKSKKIGENINYDEAVSYTHLRAHET